MTALAWVLNLDAERELVACRGGHTFVTRSLPREASAALESSWLGKSVASGTDSVLRTDGKLVEGVTSPDLAMPWCVTPSALERIAAAGLTTPFRPSLAAVVEANARESFVEERGDIDQHGGLPGAQIVRDLNEARRAIEREPPARAPSASKPPAWLLRPSLVTAGRLRLVTSAWSDSAAVFVRQHVAKGPLHIAPFVDIEHEFAVHGIVATDGRCQLGPAVRQVVTGGAWRRTDSALPVEQDVAAKLQTSAQSVAAQLANIGYCGPFGMDAFTWVDATGSRRLHTPSEVNARLTMGFGAALPLATLHRELF